jgi:hypothetical protein
MPQETERRLVEPNVLKHAQTKNMSDELIILNDIAEPETEIVTLSEVLFDGNCRYFGLGECPDGPDIDPTLPQNLVCLVEHLIGDRKHTLLLVVPDGGNCNLFPMIELKSGELRRATRRETEKLIDNCDGWLIVTLVPTYGWGPLLCFSVVLKEAWQKAGKPLMIDTRLIAITELPKACER